jgi:hypothetical protein
MPAFKRFTTVDYSGYSENPCSNILGLNHPGALEFPHSESSRRIAHAFPYTFVRNSPEHSLNIPHASDRGIYIVARW